MHSYKKKLKSTHSHTYIFKHSVERMFANTPESVIMLSKEALLSIQNSNIKYAKQVLQVIQIKMDIRYYKHFTKDYLLWAEGQAWKVIRYTVFINFIFVYNTLSRRICYNCQIKNAAFVEKMLLQVISGKIISLSLWILFIWLFLMQNWFGAAEHLTTSQGLWNIFLSAHLVLGDCFC